jgi:hypothetical protein
MHDGFGLLQQACGFGQSAKRSTRRITWTGTLG